MIEDMQENQKPNNNEMETLESQYKEAIAKLRPRQARFVEEYLVDLNGRKAAIRAGYGKKGADKQALRLLKNPMVKQAIDLAMELRARRNELTSDWVLQELKANYEKAIQAVPVRDKQGNETGMYTYQASAANRALELIGQHIGMFGKGKEGDKHLHLHDEKYVNFPPVPKDIKEWVEQMHALGYYEYDIAPLSGEDQIQNHQPGEMKDIQN